MTMGKGQDTQAGPKVADLVTEGQKSPGAEPSMRVQMVRDRFEEYALKARTLPTAKEEPKPVEAQNPNALPPEIEKLRKEGFYSFCWVKRPSNENDWVQIQNIEKAGYTLVTRENMGTVVPDHMFDVQNVVPLMDQVLFVIRTDTREARRDFERGVDGSAIAAAREGHDEEGPIPYATGFDGGLGGDVYVPPNQIGDDAAFVEDEVDSGGKAN